MSHASASHLAPSDQDRINNILTDFFLSVVTSASEVGAVRPGEVAMRINSVSFFCINKSMWDDALVSSSTSTLDSSMDPDYATAAGSGDVYQSSIYDHPCAGLKKYMSLGTFYYAQGSSWDISTRLDRRTLHLDSEAGSGGHSIADYDDRFVWNSYMIEPLLEYRSRMEVEEQRIFDAGGFIVSRASTGRRDSTYQN